MRLFTAIEVGEAVQARAAALVEELRRRAAAAAPRARVTWAAADRMHLTVRFIGEVGEDHGERIRAALRDPIPVHPFRAAWDGLGAFPGKSSPRVLWVGVAAGLDDLSAVESAVGRRLSSVDIPPEQRPYRPHLTLARVRDAAGLRAGPLFDGLSARLGETRVDAITLFQSLLSPRGPTYVVLQRTPLRG